MQVVRVLGRPRCLSPFNVAHYRCGVMKPAWRSEIVVTENRSAQVKGILSELSSSGLFSTVLRLHAQSRSLNRIESTSLDLGRKFGLTCGLAVGSTYLTKFSGSAEDARCDDDQHVKKVASEGSLEWDYRRARVYQWIRRLWVPSLCILTVYFGWQYPLSLLADLIILMWTTKPRSTSIYLWVEQKRQQEAFERRGLDRITGQTSAVMHVEVRDYKLFCLARVTSLTKRSTLIGLLGDWWVIYSSSSAIHTGVNIKSLMATVPPFVREQFSIN